LRRFLRRFDDALPRIIDRTAFAEKLTMDFVYLALIAAFAALLAGLIAGCDVLGARK